MPQFDPRRLDPAAYPHTTSIETRFQDLDTLGHINNVAMAALFEAGRVRFNRQFLTRDEEFRAGEAAAGLRWLIARVEINYLAEAHFPAPLEVTSAIGRVGRSSWDIAAAGFQSGTCVALCDATLVLTGPAGAMPIPDAFRARLAAQMMAVPA